jgi:hypothetical protein
MVLETTLQEEVLILSSQNLFVGKDVFIDLLHDEHGVGLSEQNKSGLKG